jgi:hypothetical protein
MVREPILPAGARIEVRVEDGALAIAATGKWAIFNFEKRQRRSWLDRRQTASSLSTTTITLVLLSCAT